MNNKKGFTLMEVVVSIIALAIAGIFILQFYIASSSANARAQAIDFSLAETISLVEEIKSSSSADAYTSSNLGVFEQNGIYKYIRLLDKNGGVVPIPASTYDSTIEQFLSSDDIYYVITVTLEKSTADNIDSVEIGELYIITAFANWKKYDGTVIELINFETMKYFSSVT